MRNISQLHPELKKKAVKLQKECLKVGIKIKIGECVRTVAEQNALYARVEWCSWSDCYKSKRNGLQIDASMGSCF